MKIFDKTEERLNNLADEKIEKIEKIADEKIYNVNQLIDIKIDDLKNYFVNSIIFAGVVIFTANLLGNIIGRRKK